MGGARGEGRRLSDRALGAIIVGSLLGACLLFVGGSILAFRLGRAADFRAQERRLAAYRASAPAASLSLAADLALPDAASLDSLRYLATHNSYRRASGRLRLFYIGLAEPGWPARLAYSHPALRAQLESGIRSFELDIRARKGGDFVLAHVPLVDDRSDDPSLTLALEEMALWSDRNPGHVPVILLLEIKDDYSFLDPSLAPVDAAALDRLDAALRAGLGRRLVEPDRVRGGAASLRDALRERGWPRLGELRGTFVVVIHEDERYRSLYTAGGKNLEGRAAFDCAPPGEPDQAFAILNEPGADAGRIRAALGSRVMVRTRADADLALGGLEAALASGAQIVSTDFPPGAPGPGGYIAALPGGATLDVAGGARP